MKYNSFIDMITPTKGEYHEDMYKVWSKQGNK